MKPNFALNLSHDGIGLLHRNDGSKDGWTLIGDVDVTDPALSDKLAVLRKTAADLEKGGLASKLVIPNSQILYTEIEAPGPDDIAREVQIRKSLEGVTPYDVSDLVFDWRRAKGKMVRVAVLARETLNEAEHFAKEHRFNPVCFVARPKDNAFKGEIFFGKASGAAALLGAGEQIEADTKPVPNLRNTPESAPSEPEAKATESPTGKIPPAPPQTKTKDTNVKESPAKAKAPLLPAEIPAPRDAKEDDARIAALLADVAEPDDKAPGKTGTNEPADAIKPVPAADISPSDAAPSTIPVLAPFPPTPDEGEEAPTPFIPAVTPPTTSTPKAGLSPKLVAKMAPPKAQETPAPTPVKKSTTIDTPAAAKLPDVPPVIPKDAPALPPRREATIPVRTSVKPAFSSSRAEPEAARQSTPDQAMSAPVKPSASKADQTNSGKTVPPPLSTPKAAEIVSPKGPRAPTITPNAPATSTPPILNATPPPKAALPPVKPSAEKVSKPEKTGVLTSVKQSFGRNSPPKIEATGLKKDVKTKAPAVPAKISTEKAPKKTKPAPAKAQKPNTRENTKQTAKEAERLTMFGARNAQKKQVGGKHKYLGLILTLVLLLVMAIVALSSVFFFSEETSFFSTESENEFAAAAVPDMPAVATAPVTAPADTQAATQVPPPDIPPTIPEASVSNPVDDPELADIEPEPPVDPNAPSIPDLARQDTQNGLSTDIAEAQYAATGIWQKAPEPPGEPQSSRIDDLYVASIDPAISSHDAVALPSEDARVADARPASPLPPAAAGTDFALNDNGLVTPTPEGTLSPEGILVFSGKPPVVPGPRPGTIVQQVTDPNGLQAFRPKPRPTALVENNQRANLGGNTLAELSRLRPVIRPVSLQAAAEAAVENATESTPSALAVASSPTPDYRPGDFASLVARARETASASDGSSAVAVSAAATSVPSIPTRASVATQATINNAIRLNRVNLIGIFGSSSSRRALVRLRNGRYVKVSIGDRLDGGKVVSISQTQLIYKKSGRNHALDVLPLG